MKTLQLFPAFLLKMAGEYATMRKAVRLPESAIVYIFKYKVGNK